MKGFNEIHPKNNLLVNNVTLFDEMNARSFEPIKEFPHCWE